MRIPLSICWAAAVLLLDAGLANGSHIDDDKAQAKECAFKLSATGGSFPHPAGQLGDGTLRLNGTQPPAIFYIDGQSSITDSHGCGCFVADSSGLQCQSGTPSAQGFAIDTSFTLLHNNSPQFYACPVDNTGYGIFVQLPGDKSKCISITLKTNSSCSTAPPLHQSPSYQASPSTLWRTSTITDHTTQSVTVVVTVCEPSSISFFKSTPTQNAQGLKVRDLSPRASVLSHNCDDEATRRLLKRDPGDLNKSWLQVQSDKPTHFVKQNDIRVFPLNVNEDDIFATEEFYGCTVIVFVGKESITIAHMAEGMGRICPLSSSDLTNQYTVTNLADKVKYPVDAGECDDLYVVITGTERDNNPNNGVGTLKEFIMGDYGVKPENLRYISYTPMASTSEYGGPVVRDPVLGRSFFEWKSCQTYTAMTIYLGSEKPRLIAKFNKDWTPKDITWGQSKTTTDGNGNKV